MKKFLLYIILPLMILGGGFAYLLYQEGAFQSKEEYKESLPPFMKCEAGKCQAGKCASGKCQAGKCAGNEK
jgi:hypothetical protein